MNLKKKMEIKIQMTQFFNNKKFKIKIKTNSQLTNILLLMIKFFLYIFSNL
jgi:hypothetical protein